MKTKMLTLAAAVFSVLACNSNEEMKPQEGYIGPSEIRVTDGRMSPEVLLSLGRLSDPQLSPDGKTILFGVSYTSIEENRSVRNLFTIPVEGGEKTQLTMDGKSIANARWAPDGKSVYFLQGGQIWQAPYENGKLGKRVCCSDVPRGIDEFSLSPDGMQVMYVSTVHSAVERPVDTDPMLSKANAYATEDLMYRHWDHCQGGPGYPGRGRRSLPTPERPVRRHREPFLEPGRPLYRLFLQETYRQGLCFLYRYRNLHLLYPDG